MPEREAEFLAGYDPAAFERPSVAVDVVLLTVRQGRLVTLLVRRPEHPFKDQWSLPGGFVGMRESLEAAAARVLRAKAALDGVFTEQLFTFGRPDRDPRMRILSVAYYALVSAERLGDLEAPGQVALAEVWVPWEGESGGPVQVRVARKAQPLAFDHAEILGAAVKRLRGKLNYAPVGFELLPERFTLRQLQEIHEAILGRTLNKDSFRRKVLASSEIEPTNEKEEGQGFRPAELYRRRQRAEGREQRAKGKTIKEEQ